MSFFEPPPPTPERPPPGRRPPWFGPPENEIGVAVPQRLVLGRTGDIALALVDVVAYSSGFTLRLALRVHHDAPDIDPRQMMMQLHGGPPGSGEERLQFGIEFSDGRKATNLGPRRPPDDQPPPIALTPHGGGGGGGRSLQIGYWVYPVAPKGPLTLAIAWPSKGIPEQTHTLDATPIIDAAADSAVLWEDDRPIHTRGPGPQPGGTTWRQYAP